MASLTRFSAIKVEGIQVSQAQAQGPPKAPVDSRFEPYFDTFEIVEDLQGGTIREAWLVGGNPYQAQLHPALGDGLNVGDPHQFFPDHFMVRRHFKYHAQSKTEAERITLLTMTWQKIPCPHRLAIDFGTVLVSQPSWWSLETPPKNLSESFAGEAVVRPLIVMTMRIPLLAQAAKIWIDLAEQVGTRNKGEFVFRPEGFWYFEDIRVRQLWGSAEPLLADETQQVSNSRWEVALTFRGDPWRHHARWQAKFPQKRQPIPEEDEDDPENPVPDDITANLPLRPASSSFADMRAAHNVFQPYPIAERPFLQDIDIPTELCAIPDLGS